MTDRNQRTHNRRLVFASRDRWIILTRIEGAAGMLRPPAVVTRGAAACSLMH